MMRTLYTFLLLAFCVWSSSAQSIPDPTRITISDATNLGDPLVLKYQDYYYYDQDGLLEQLRLDHRVNNAWQISGNNYNYRLPDGQIQLVELKSIAMGIEEIYAKEVFTFDANQRPVKGEYLKLDPNTGIFKLQSETSHVYTGANITLTTHFAYSDDTIVFAYKRFVSFDSFSRQYSTEYHNWTNGTFLPSGKFDIFYLGQSDTIVRTESQQWNAAAQAWNTVNYRSLYTYFPQKKVILTEIDGQGNWMPSTRQTYTYNTTGEEINLIQELMDGNWFEQLKVVTDYNTDRSRHQVRAYLRNQQNEPQHQVYQADYEYGIFTPTNEPNLSNSVQYRLFPNPTNGAFHLRDQDGVPPAQFNLQDQNGRVIAMQVRDEQQTQVIMANQPAGLYFVQVIDGGKVEVLPFVKQ